MDKKKQRILKPVSFNLRDPDERKILEKIQEDGINFSGLVKKLLFAYLLEEKVPSQPTTMNVDYSDQLAVPQKSEQQNSDWKAPDFGGMPFDWD